MIKNQNEIDSVNASGQCLCGHVSFQIHGPIRQIVVCHCDQCQQWSGPSYYSQAKISDVQFDSKASLKWFRSSSNAQRGFCLDCGTNMFWAKDEGEAWAIAAGILSTNIPLKVVGHIFCADRPPYDQINDDLPRFDTTSGGQLDHLLT